MLSLVKLLFFFTFKVSLVENGISLERLSAAALLASRRFRFELGVNPAIYVRLGYIHLGTGFQSVIHPNLCAKQVFKLYVISDITAM